MNIEDRSLEANCSSINHNNEDQTHSHDNRTLQSITYLMIQEPNGSIHPEDKAVNFNMEEPKSPVMANQETMMRRESMGSVKSLKSYQSIRESLAKMHSYVEQVAKLDKEQSKNSEKISRSFVEKPNKDKLNSSQYECINEIESECEFSHLPAAEEFNYDPTMKRKYSESSDINVEEGTDKVDQVKKQFSMINLKRRNFGSTSLNSHSVNKNNHDLKESNQKAKSQPRRKPSEIERKPVENPPIIGVKRIFQDSSNKEANKQEKLFDGENISNSKVRIISKNEQKRVEVQSVVAAPLKKEGLKICALCDKELKIYEKTKLLRCTHKVHDLCFKERNENQQQNGKPKHQNQLQPIYFRGQQSSTVYTGIQDCNRCNDHQQLNKENVVVDFNKRGRSKEPALKSINS